MTLPVADMTPATKSDGVRKMNTDGNGYPWTYRNDSVGTYSTPLADRVPVGHTTSKVSFHVGAAPHASLAIVVVYCVRPGCTRHFTRVSSDA